MLCQRCQKPFDELLDNALCVECNDKMCSEFAEEHAEEHARIETLKQQGHPEHCACRQVWGDGECECDLYKQGYDPYAWIKTYPVQKYGVVATPEDVELEQYPPEIFRKELINKALHEAAKALLDENLIEYTITMSITKEHNPLEKTTKFTVFGEVYPIKVTINPVIGMHKL